MKRYCSFLTAPGPTHPSSRVGGVFLTPLTLFVPQHRRRAVEASQQLTEIINR